MGRRIVAQSRPWVMFGQNLVRVINEGSSIMDRTILRLITGRVIYAASPTLSDVLAAIASASPGDTVIIPEGSATWPSQLIVTKGILLKGAGVGRTVITCTYSGGSAFDTTGYPIVYAPSNPSLNSPFRLSGMTISVSGNFFMVYNMTVTMINQIRLDHLAVSGVAGYFLFNRGTSAGCMDNCTINGGSYRGMGMDADAWTHLTYEHGTLNNWYMEDCSFPSSSNMMGYLESSWYAFRHCVITGSNEYPMFDAHGNQPTAHHATFGLELSDNIINGSSIQFLDLRGGRALVYNNVLSGGAAMHCREEFLDSQNAPAFASNGEPQHVNDTYVWNNTQSGSRFAMDTSGTLDYGGSVGIVPRENVHFWNQQTSFNGSVGIGVGLRSARPGVCTAEGVAYWATDEKLLYRWHNGAWELYYTPLAYPHPLRTLLGD